MHHVARTLITVALLVPASTWTTVARADEPGWVLQPTVDAGAAYSSAVHVDRGEQMGIRVGPAIRLLSPIGVGIYARGMGALSFSMRDPVNETTPTRDPCTWGLCLRFPETDMLTSVGGDVGVFHRSVLVPAPDVELAAIVEIGASGVWIDSSFESFGSHGAAGVVAGALLELVLPSQLTIAIGIDMRIMVPVDDALGGVWLGVTPMLRIGKRYSL